MNMIWHSIYNQKLMIIILYNTLYVLIQIILPIIFNNSISKLQKQNGYVFAIFTDI
jgi:hypothetical protein